MESPLKQIQQENTEELKMVMTTASKERKKPGYSEKYEEGLNRLVKNLVSEIKNLVLQKEKAQENGGQLNNNDKTNSLTSKINVFKMSKRKKTKQPKIKIFDQRVIKSRKTNGAEKKEHIDEENGVEGSGVKKVKTDTAVLGKLDSFLGINKNTEDLTQKPKKKRPYNKKPKFDQSGNLINKTNKDGKPFEFNDEFLSKKAVKRYSKNIEKAPNRVYVYDYLNEEGKVEIKSLNQSQPYEISFFKEQDKKIVKVVFGLSYAVILSEEGKVYVWRPRKESDMEVEGESDLTVVELEEPVDLISSGNRHIVAGSSQTGVYYIWGVIENKNKEIVFNQEKPVKVQHAEFVRKGLKDIQSGCNHTLFLAHNRAFAFGVNCYGSLGSPLKSISEINNPLTPRLCLKENAERIFAIGNHSFIIDSENKLYGFGDNTHNQLGLSQNNGLTRVLKPMLVDGVNGVYIKKLLGNIDNTFLLTNNGWIYGVGNNTGDKMGTLGSNFNLGGFKKILSLPTVSKIAVSDNLNICEDINSKYYYCWGNNLKKKESAEIKKNENLVKLDDETYFYGKHPTFIGIIDDKLFVVVNNLGNKRALNERLIMHKKEMNSKK